MIKGCSKRVVYLKNTDSSIFEEAYFVLGRAEVAVRASDRDMIREAERIVCESAGETACVRHGRRRGGFYFAMGSVSATALYLVIGVIVYLCA